MLQIIFESDFQKKIMEVSFGPNTQISSVENLRQIKTEWLAELKKWHSPYKALIDFSNVQLSFTPETTKEWSILIKFLKGFFLLKICGFGTQEWNEELKIYATREEAGEFLGIRDLSKKAAPTDFRSSIQFQNDFKQHVIELTWAHPIKLETVDQLNTLKSKLMNNLSQWHSAWNLLIDCSELEISAELFPKFEEMLKFFKQLFLKKIIGYGQRSTASFPFPVLRARHLAVAQLESEGFFQADEAHCRSKQ